MSEDFTSYTEVDPNSKITETTTRVTWASIARNEEAYVYKDKGVGYFDGDFSVLMTLKPVESTTGSGDYASPFMLANDLDDERAFIFSKSYDCLCLGLSDPSASGVSTKLYIYEVDNGSLYTGAGGLEGNAWWWLTNGTIYYLKLIRNESVGTYGTFYCYIYSDALRSNLLATLSVALHTSKKDFRYIYPFSNYNATTGGWNHSGYVENLSLSGDSEGYIHIYPTDPTTRVTSIIHRYDRGVYNTELLFGDVISDFSISNVDSSTSKTYQSKEELGKINKAMPTPQPIPTAPTSPVQPTPSPTVATPTSQPPTGIVELTQYAKDILATPAGQAAVARQQGLAQGVEAVVTPYAIDVLKRNEEEAKLLTQIQKMTTAAKATGITSYARGVLLQAIVDAKARLKELYKQ